MTQDVKSLFLSKTFIFNVLSLALTVAHILPPKYGLPAVTIVNVLLRMVTNQPVSLLGPFPTK